MGIFDSQAGGTGGDGGCAGEGVRVGLSGNRDISGGLGSRDDQTSTGGGLKSEGIEI